MPKGALRKSMAEVKATKEITAMHRALRRQDMKNIMHGTGFGKTKHKEDLAPLITTRDRVNAYKESSQQRRSALQKQRKGTSNRMKGVFDQGFPVSPKQQQEFSVALSSHATQKQMPSRRLKFLLAHRKYDLLLKRINN